MTLAIAKCEKTRSLAGPLPKFKVRTSLKSWEQLGTISPKYRLKSRYTMRESARRDNYLAFLSLPWAQEVWSSNLHAPTNCSTFF